MQIKIAPTIWNLQEKVKYKMLSVLTLNFLNWFTQYLPVLSLNLRTGERSPN